VRRFVSDGFTALFATVNDYITALGVGKRSYRAKYSAAVILAVAGVDINVKRAKAEWAVVTRGVSERKHLFAAIGTNKAAIIFLKAFIFHYFYSFTARSGICLQIG
jgi:hypothetical protein